MGSRKTLIGAGPTNTRVYNSYDAVRGEFAGETMLGGPELIPVTGQEGARPPQVPGRNAAAAYPVSGAYTLILPKESDPAAAAAD